MSTSYSAIQGPTSDPIDSPFDLPLTRRFSLPRLLLAAAVIALSSILLTSLFTHRDLPPADVALSTALSYLARHSRSLSPAEALLLADRESPPFSAYFANDDDAALANLSPLHLRHISSSSHPISPLATSVLYNPVLLLRPTLYSPVCPPQPRTFTLRRVPVNTPPSSSPSPTPSSPCPEKCAATSFLAFTSCRTLASHGCRYVKCGAHQFTCTSAHFKSSNPLTTTPIITHPSRTPTPTSSSTPTPSITSSPTSSSSPTPTPTSTPSITPSPSPSICPNQCGPFSFGGLYACNKLHAKGCRYSRCGTMTSWSCAMPSPAARVTTAKSISSSLHIKHETLVSAPIRMARKQPSLHVARIDVDEHVAMVESVNDGFVAKAVQRKRWTGDVCPRDYLRLMGFSIGSQLTYKVDLSAGPWKTDVFYLIDGSSSMKQTLAILRESRGSLLNLFGDRPDVAYGLAMFRNERNRNIGLSVRSTLTTSRKKMLRKLSHMSAYGGGGQDEATLVSLFRIATTRKVGWRRGARRFVILIGDRPGHEPSCPRGYKVTRAKVINALRKQRISVMSINVGPKDGGLDAVPEKYRCHYRNGIATGGQASEISKKTLGSSISVSDPTKLTMAITNVVRAVPSRIMVATDTCQFGFDSKLSSKLPKIVPAGERMWVANTITLKEDICKLPEHTYQCYFSFFDTGGYLGFVRVRVIKAKGCPYMGIE